MSSRDLIRNFQVPVFFGLSLFAWVIWGLQAGYRYGYLAWAPSLQSPVNALTVWSPGLAAIALTWFLTGKRAVADLFRPLLQWRVPFRWYVLALLFEPAKWCLAYGLDKILGGNYQLGEIPLLKTFGGAAAFMVPVALVFTLPNSLGEELGWRGFALPKLQQACGALPASILIGLYWGGWHVPMWLTWSKAGLSWLSLFIMVCNLVPVATLFTLLYNRTGGSLLLVCLFHASMASKGYLMPSLPTLTETFILWGAAIMAVLFGGFRLGQPELRASFSEVRNG